MTLLFLVVLDKKFLTATLTHLLYHLNNDLTGYLYYGYHSCNRLDFSNGAI